MKTEEKLKPKKKKIKKAEQRAKWKRERVRGG